ncbi:replicative DNA helicase [Pseudoxanthomonas winnipegensis]|uniref:replicative DNA helicase n=1 Tax=Pseudoxanthomonas winnipegensis TaxID=2480810 RepID=UPI00102DE44A|nr:DnaB-like helicase C-terminal domain-containing protein [Pseudoxanthomonas winnipegensis]RZZ85668.1 helicase DnaB [Pseudoxanthomonas winnipegensis]
MDTPVYAEEAVLQGVMARNEALHDVLTLVSAEQFTSPFRQRLWSAIRDAVLAGEPADAVTLCDALPNDGIEIMEMAASAITGSSVVAYAEIVRENWRMREAAGIGQRLLMGARGRDPESVNEAISALLALNAEVTEHEFTGKQILNMAYQITDQAYRNGGKLPGITTGMNALDEILGGFHDSDLTLIGARPAMGKTALMLCLAEAAAIAGKRVGIVSAEQPAAQIGLRRAALASRVSATSMRSGNVQTEDWSKLTAGIGSARDRAMWIYDRSAVTLDELVGVARKWKHTHGVEILFVDYAQRITVPRADRITEVSLVARGLKNLARDLQIPLVSLAQVVKGVDTRTDKRPTAGDLANSDELTREADQILMLYRDEVYNRESQDQGLAEILIEKNRHGPTGYKKVRFVAETMSFEDLHRDNYMEAAA